MILPQCEIFLPADAQEIVFVAGGRPPNFDWFKKIIVGRKIFCVDRGIEVCRACNVLPDFLLGDFDSATADSVAWASKKIFTEKYPADKDLTDTQLALRRATEIFGEHVALVTGGFGGRLDHLYSVLFTCAAENRKVVLADEREIIFFVKDRETVTAKFNRLPKAASLLPITSVCRGVSTKNFHWELDGATLTQALPYAVSNRVAGDKISVGVGRGTLAVYLCFAE